MITAMSPLPYMVPASWMPSSVRKVTDVPGTGVAVEILVEVGAIVGVEGLSVAVGVAVGTVFPSQALTRASTAIRNAIFVKSLSMVFIPYT
jgi:hypothetical protein